MQEKPNKLWSKSFLILVISNIFVYTGFQMLIPTLPVYVEELGGNEIQASLVVSLFALSALIFRSITGNAVDKYGRRLLMIIGFMFLIVFNFSFFWATFIPLILALRFFHGIGWGMTSTSIATVMSDLVPDSHRGEGTGYYALSVILATSLAPILAILLMENHPFSFVLKISTALFFIGLISMQVVKYQKVKPQSQVKNKKRSIRDLFEKQALLPSFLCMLLAIPFGGLMSFIILFGEESGVDNIWIYFIGHVFMILVTRPFVGKLFDRKGHLYVVLPGTLCMIIGIVILSFTTTIPTLVAASVFFGVGFGSVQPSLQAWAINRSGPDRKGAANGTFLSGMDLGVAVGTVILGGIAGYTSYAMMYRLSAVFLLILVGVYVGYLVREKKETLDAKEEMSV